MRAGIPLLAVFLLVGGAAGKAQQGEPTTLAKPEFKFADGQRVYILALEMAGGAKDKLQTRFDGYFYAEAVRQIQKRGRFVIGSSLSDADFVLVFFRYGNGGDKAIGLVAQPEDVKRCVVVVNEVRQEVDFDSLMSVSLWNSQGHARDAVKIDWRRSFGGTTYGWVRPKVVDVLLEKFYKEVL